MKQPAAQHQQSLQFSDVIVMAQTGAIDHAFHNLLGYAAALKRHNGDLPTALASTEQMIQEQRRAGQQARFVLTTNSTAHQRLHQWFHLRGFDQEPTNQKLASRLEEHVQRDFPAPFAASLPWLRQGLSPQAALVRAVENHQATTNPDQLAHQMAHWVVNTRTDCQQLRHIHRTDKNPDEAGEAIFEIRALRDFHLRILLGLGAPQDVGQLEAVDSPLALAACALWSDDHDSQQPQSGEIVARLAQFAGYTYQRHPVALELYHCLHQGHDHNHPHLSTLNQGETTKGHTND